MASRLASSQTQTGTARLHSEGRESTLLWIEKMVSCSHLYKDQNTNFLFLEDLTRRTGGPGDLQEVLEPTVIFHL